MVPRPNWKISIEMNFKKINNYRPVSLTSIACKLFESIIKDAIVSHMKKNKLFSKHQFGFLSGRSTTYQLLIVLEKWNEIVDNRGQVDTIYFDYMKAFDSVPHKRLLVKLEAYGIKNKVLNWIKACLCNRRQAVSINGTTSSWSSVTSGIPQ
ncbi:MAG: hypothetical protein GY782_00040, partial [Gammaproteobacteria bacterium]|nr:hypothetical protein [Gammaproteobacteria bacterium]